MATVKSNEQSTD